MPGLAAISKVRSGLRLALTPTTEHRETPCFEAAVHLGKSRIVHPLQLVLDRGATIVGHPLERFGDFLFGYAQHPDLLQPDTGVTGLYLAIMAEDLLGVDEQAPPPTKRSEFHRRDAFSRRLPDDGSPALR